MLARSLPLKNMKQLLLKVHKATRQSTSPKEALGNKFAWPPSPQPLQGFCANTALLTHTNSRLLRVTPLSRVLSSARSCTSFCIPDSRGVHGISQRRGESQRGSCVRSWASTLATTAPLACVWCTVFKTQNVYFLGAWGVHFSQTQEVLKLEDF